jgi:hypothetical protein
MEKTAASNLITVYELIAAHLKALLFSLGFDSARLSTGWWNEAVHNYDTGKWSMFFFIYIRSSERLPTMCCILFFKLTCSRV